MSTTIRINEQLAIAWRCFPDSTGLTMTRLVDEAVEALERKLFFETFNERYRDLRADTVAWAEIVQERLREEGAVAESSA